MLEEPPQLVRRPDRHRLALDLRRVGVGRDVADDIPAFHRVFERPVQGPVSVADGLGRQALAAASALDLEGPVTAIEVLRGQLLQRDTADEGVQVALDRLPVGYDSLKWPHCDGQKWPHPRT